MSDCVRFFFSPFLFSPFKQRLPGIGADILHTIQEVVFRARHVLPEHAAKGLQVSRAELAVADGLILRPPAPAIPIVRQRLSIARMNTLTADAVQIIVKESEAPLTTHWRDATAVEVAEVEVEVEVEGAVAGIVIAERFMDR